MCRRIAKYGLVMLLLALAGFAVGSLLTMIGYIALWWEFPRTWQPLTGLAGVPQDLLAMQAPNGPILLRTEGGQLFTCYQGRCEPQYVDWSPEALTCDETNRPAVVSLFPVILSRDIQLALGCESGYQSTGNTAYVVYSRQGVAYWSGGMTMIPTDAGVLIVGMLGGVVGAVAAALLVGIIGIVLFARSGEARRSPSEMAI